MVPVQTILVPVDFSAHSEAALTQAVELAREFEARIHLLHCYEVPYPGVAEYQVAIPDTIWERIREAATRSLEELREKAAAGGVETTADVSREPPSEAIAAAAKRLGADLIVVGTRGNTGLDHLLFGSVAERTVRTAPCSVLTVKAPKESASSSTRTSVEKLEMKSIRTVVAAVDFSPNSEQALEVAGELARRFGAELHIVHAFSLPAVVSPYGLAVWDRYFEDARGAASKELDALMQKISAEGLEAKSHLSEAPAALGVVRTAEELGADLIVMGTRGHTGLKHALLGSVAERTLRLAPCAVLTVRHPEGGSEPRTSARRRESGGAST
jgi:nucleotide-binding universal stress UspA family protein